MALPGTFIPNLAVGKEWERSIEAQHAVDEVGENVAKVAQTLAPVDTGALREAIAAHAVDGEGARNEVIAAVPYAGFVEFGTSLMAAQPFLRPALDQVAGG